MHGLLPRENVSSAPPKKHLTASMKEERCVELFQQGLSPKAAAAKIECSYRLALKHYEKWLQDSLARGKRAVVFERQAAYEQVQASLTRGREALAEDRMAVYVQVQTALNRGKLALEADRKALYERLKNGG
jgi:hypothetical protein